VTASTTTSFSTFTGRAPADDAADVQLKLLYGGSAGASNPGLIKDNVNANDKLFLPGFPYLPAPW